MALSRGAEIPVNPNVTKHLAVLLPFFDALTGVPRYLAAWLREFLASKIWRRGVLGQGVAILLVAMCAQG